MLVGRPFQSWVVVVAFGVVGSLWGCAGSVEQSEAAEAVPVLPVSDRKATPVSPVAPIYPRSAVERGTEGWVQLEFTVSVTGVVMNPRVIKSMPLGGTFDDAALHAIRQWKYKPQLKNGVAIETPGMRVKLSFKHADQ